MASKYAHLKGKVPQEPTEREQAIEDLISKWKDDSLATLVAAYNAAVVEAALMAASVKALNQKQTARDILIRRKLEADDMDAVTIDGFNWTELCEPYPSCDDIDAVVQYFKDNGMEDQLTLTKTELASRLKKIVKEEAANNELKIEMVDVTDPNTGETKSVQVVRSNVPGVKVYIDKYLGRTKASAKTSTKRS